jgi:hypothetical protein
LKELVPYVGAFEQAMAKIEELTAVIQRYESGDTEVNEGTGKPDPEVKKLRTELETIKQGQRRQEQEDQQRVFSSESNKFKVAGDELEKIEELDGPGFKLLRDEYKQAQNLNPYASMPQKLALMASIASSIAQSNPGLPTLEVVKQAWKAANSDRLEENWKRKLAKDQERKRGLPALNRKGAIPKAPSDTRGQSIKEIVEGIVDKNLSG